MMPRAAATWRSIPKPREGEFAPYAIMYIGLLPDDGRVLDHLERNARATSEMLLALPEERLSYTYAAGKWTIRDIVQHVSDDERIYSYRALRFARGDATDLPGFEQDDYARHSRANERSIADLVDELATVRRATISFFASLDDEALSRSGMADGKRMSVRAIAYHIAGHELHHVNLIRRLYI
jgi:uncharacterized damage-inducible protein DinB